MPVLRPITEMEFAAWREATIPDYAAQKVASGAWREDEAIERSRREMEELLPDGRATEGHHLHTVLAAGGEPVGTLWFAERERGRGRIAYVYDIVIDAAHRRQGHGRRAFEALEDEVARLGLDGIALHVFGHNTGAHALYVALGYVPTNIHMYKPVKAAGT